MKNPATLSGIFHFTSLVMSDAAAGASPKTERKQQQRSIVTQQKLLDAAIEAFSENGFKGTSTRDIAERAGVHHPLITYHFKNKDTLWRAAADRVFRDFRRSLAASLEEHQGECPKERMASLIRAYVFYAKSQPALHKVMVQEASYPNPRLDWLIETHLKPFFDATFEMLEQLQAPCFRPWLESSVTQVKALTPTATRSWTLLPSGGTRNGWPVVVGVARCRWFGPCGATAAWTLP